MQRSQLGLQSLESREVPASVQLTLVSQNNFTMAVTGTVPGEVIELRSPTANSVQVFSNDQPVSAPIVGLPIRTIGINGNGKSDDLVISGVPTGVVFRVNVSNFENVTIGDEIAEGKFSLAKVLSEVSVAGVPNGDLDIRGNGDTGAKNVTVTSNTVTGLAPVPMRFTLAAGPTTSLGLTTGDSDDTVTVESTFAGGALGLIIATNGGQDTFNIERDSTIVRLQGGAGNDTFNVAPVTRQLGGVDSRIIISGGTGTNELVIHDENRGVAQTSYDATFTVEPQAALLTVDQLNLQSGATDTASVAYSGVQSVRFLAPTAVSDTDIAVLATPAGVSTIIESGRASEVRVGDGDIQENIQGALTVNRTDFGGKLILDDSAATEFRGYFLNANNVETGNSLVSFDNNTTVVDLRTTSANDFIVLHALRGNGAKYAIDAGTGTGNFQGLDTGNSWTLNGPGQGLLNGNSLEFRNIDVLQGGLGSDHFRFVNDKATFLNIHADPFDNNFNPIPNNALDTIDYSLLAMPVNVDLAVRRGTLVGNNNSPGQLNGIDAIFGSQSGDTLTGNTGNNVLHGFGGNDVIIGGGGKDILIGGGGKDDLSNGNFETIYVAGDTTSFTTFQLRDMRNEWTRTDATYQQRVDHIRNGGGLNGTARLSSTTILEDNAVDTIHAGAALDLIFLHGVDLISANPPQTQQEIVNL